ncbi:MAG: transposase [Acidobacteriaceae bacterium]|nr:transposase [Acidobacteriaceae bacterium]
MQITPRERLLRYGQWLQGTLFSLWEAETGALSDKAKLLIAVLEMLPLSRQLPCARGWLGRPAKDRQALASAFIAKSVYGLQSTRQLLQRLHTDRQLRCVCGWTSVQQIPHESTFSRAFQEFAETELPQRLHEALILHTQQDRLVGHMARDSTAVEARERFAGSRKHPSIPKRKRGRPRTCQRAAAYDANEIREHSRSLGHVPLISPVARRQFTCEKVRRKNSHSAKIVRRVKAVPPRQLTWAEEDRMQERSMCERVFARLKDEFGGRAIRVRGATKIMAHLMFGVLALSVDQLLRLTG